MTCPRCKAIMRAISGGGKADTFDARLIVEAGPQRVGEQLLLAGQGIIKIGKLEGKPIRLEGTLVSRNHCRLVRTTAGGWMVEDAKSTNGLFVNGQRTQAADLKDGDRVKVGEYTLRFASGQPRPQPQRPQTQPPNDLYALAEMEAAAPEAPAVQVVVPGTGVPDPAAAGAAPGLKCPSCSRVFPAGSKICVQCGIDLKTGRAILTSKGLDEDALAERADTWIRLLSWFIPFGLFPIASEAFGTRKPLATWAITAATVLASVLFLPVAWGLLDAQSGTLNLMQWSGDREAAQKQIEDNVQEVAKFVEAARPRDTGQPRRRAHQSDPENTLQLEDIQEMMQAEASKAVPPGVDFHWYQPFTSALLHGGILHLAGNLLFLLVFGLRVNELVGNLKMAVFYPLLALMAGLVDHMAHADSPMYPTLGASGAIMGLAGMYFVFFPLHKVHMAIWFRGGIFTGWRCFYKLFRMGGFWLLVPWIGLQDVLPMALGSQDHTAHWAHLGGFVAGAILALGLLFSRTVSARGGDLVSMVLGRHAWALVGKPMSN